MWAVVSMSFVLGMREKGQGTVVSLVNKDLTGERSLSKSVLFVHEMPTVGLAAWGLGYWSPKVVLVDLMGTCDQTSPALQMQLFARLPTWAKSMPHWSRGAFALRSRLQWQCIDCSGACSLDKALAEHVDTLVKAKEEQDRKDRELLQVVAPKAAIKELLVEYGLQDLHLGRELMIRPLPVTRYREVKDRMDALNKNLTGLVLVSKSLQGIQKDDDRTRKRRVERLLRQKADPSALDRFGNTALSQAADAGHVDVLETLMKHGNQLEARDQQGCTALIHAARRGHLEVVKALLKAGAQLEAHDNSGRTALLVAAKEDHLKVVEALLKAGARPEARGQYNWTFFDLARHHPGLADILKKHLEAQ
ncbi:unnamed protein product [Symbiodinium sp. CCMP2456]|nr:unnamed protein product [Symbiodinium sp. CCMP2456]